jgi:hypothetical protein
VRNGRCQVTCCSKSSQHTCTDGRDSLHGSASCMQHGQSALRQVFWEAIRNGHRIRLNGGNGDSSPAPNLTTTRVCT